jgi:hypothetical protein
MELLPESANVASVTHQCGFVVKQFCHFFDKRPSARELSMLKCMKHEHQAFAFE